MNTPAKQLVAVAVCALVLPLHAQDAPQAPRESPDQGGVMLHIHVNAVLVPVVVRDAQGLAVGDLKQEDFKVFDQGKPRPLSGFSVQQGAPLQGSAQPVAPAPAAPGTVAAPATAATRFIVFLFDDRHLGISDIAHVKEAGTQMLDMPLADSDRAVVLSFLGVNSGMTHDHAVLQAAVMKLKLQQAYQPGRDQCPDIDYYAADQILNKHDASEFQIAIEKASNCTHNSDATALEQLVRTAATVALETGDQDVRETLTYLRDVIHTMSNLPGQRMLILVSPGFLSNSDEALMLQSQILDLAASSNVTINALDARGLFSGFVPARQTGSGSVFGDITGHPLQNHLESMRENEDIMAKLADGTGGTFFRDNNDLQGGLRTLTAGPECRYLLEFSLQDIKPNGAYHALRVDVDRKGLKLVARRGYFAPFPTKIKK